MSANTKDSLVYLKSNLLFKVLWFCLYSRALVSCCLSEAIQLSKV